MTQAEFFDNLASTWDVIERPDISKRLRRVVDASLLSPGQRVLDVGTGTGVLLPLLAERVGETGRIVAMDISAGMLAVARAKRFRGSITFLQADLEGSGLPDASFDRVFCNAVFPHFTDPEGALAEIRRILRPGGLLLISHPIGREAVNAIHRDGGEVVAHDIVPGPEAMRRLLEESGLCQVTVIDEPDFFLATGYQPDPKPDQQG